MNEEQVLNYELVIVGQRRIDPNDNTKQKLFIVSKSNPGIKALNANFTSQRFFQCRLRPLNGNPFLIDGPPKVITQNYFENSHSYFFSVLYELFGSKKLKQIEGTDWFTGNEPIVMPGVQKIEPCEFDYIRQTVDPKTRERGPLEANYWNNKKGDFELRKVIDSKVTLFIPKSQLGNMDSLLKAEIRRVKEFAVEIKTTTVDGPGKTTTIIESEKERDEDDQTIVKKPEQIEDEKENLKVAS